MPEHVTPAEFAARFPQLFTRSAFRLETLDRYQSDIEAEPFRRFLAGQPDDLAWRRPWQATVREARAAGKIMRRVHIIDEPLSDYLRFELQRVYPASVEAGESVRIISSRAAGPTGGDFWLIDGWLATMHYRDGTWTGVTLTDDRAAVGEHRAFRDFLLSAAIPLTDYLARTQHRRTA